MTLHYVIQKDGAHDLVLPPLILNGEKENMSDISNKKASWAFEHSNPFKYSPGSHSQLVSCFVGIMSSCSLLVFCS